MPRLSALLGATLALILAAQAAATTYTLSNATYTRVNGVYAAATGVTGSFTTAAPLPPGLNLASIASGTGGLGYVTSWSFSDGVNTFTEANSGPLSNNGPFFSVSTDGAGAITDMRIDLVSPLFLTASRVENRITLDFIAATNVAALVAGIYTCPSGAVGGVCGTFFLTSSFASGASAAFTSGSSAQNKMFVTNFHSNSVTVYPRDADGNIAPMQTIAGSTTRLNGPGGLAVDEIDDEIFVANTVDNSITVYDIAANGDVKPVRRIAGASTGLNGPWGIFVDPENDELFVANNFSPGTITVYARTADLDAAPLRTLSGAATALDNPINVAVDTVNNELIVANATGIAGRSITVYLRTASNVDQPAPVRNIHGPTTGLDNPVGVAVDTVHNELVETNFTPSVTTFSRTADGDALHVRSIAGPDTGLSQTAGGVALDTVNGLIYVVNTNNNSITVYPRLADRDALPKHTLAGNLTGLDQPSFVAITAGPAPPTGVTLLNPLTDEVIAQNHARALCPSDPTRGSGYKIKFGWEFARPPTFNHFHLHVQHVGTPVAPVDVDVTNRRYKLVACNSVISNSDLANWFWQVTAFDNFGAVLGTSEQRPFSFATCRLSNGAPCAP